MTKEEFTAGNFTQVRRNNITNSKVINVKGSNGLEGLVIIDEPGYDRDVAYIRYENADIITKNYVD